MSNGSWRVDETYVKVKGRWVCLYRAVDGRGQTVDFLLSAKRDAEAAKRFFRWALAQPYTVNPRTITVDKNAAYPKAAAERKKAGELGRCSRLRQVKYLNNIVEQDGTVQRPGGSCRFGKGQVGISDPVKSTPESGAECAVVDRATNLEQQIGSISRPSHLLRLVHASTDQEIRCAFGD
jgi:DDE domain